MWTQRYSNSRPTNSPLNQKPETAFTVGGYVIKPDYRDPDVAVVTEVGDGDEDISIAFLD